MCGDTCPSRPARSAAARMISHAFWRLTRWPRRPRNRAGVALPRPESSGRARTRYASMAFRAKLPTGTIRCLSPLPVSRTTSVSSTSSTLRFTASETRAPVA